MDGGYYAGIALFFLFIFIVLLVGISLIPGIIATRKQHPYAIWIWLLATVGSLLSGGLGWIGALIWALIPPKNAPVMPGASTSSASPTWSPSVPSASKATSGSTVEAELAELQRLLDTKQISQEEYEALRRKTLGI